MKCNIRKGATDNALRGEDLSVIDFGLSLLEEEIESFLSQKVFTEISEETAKKNIQDIAGVRTQLKAPRQKFSLNEMKVIYVGLNYLRDELEKPEEERNPILDSMKEYQIPEYREYTAGARQKLIAAFSRMGVDIHSSMRGF